MSVASRYGSSLPNMFASAWRSAELLSQLTQREIIGRYRGSILGIAWTFFNPLILLAVYTFVFSAVFKLRWGIESESRAEFALVLFIGLIIHGVVAECLSKSPGLMLNHVSYVKKVIFPLEILPVVIVGSALFHALISICVWSVFFLVVNAQLQLTMLLLPLIMLPLLFFALGLSWMLSALGVYLRDINQLTGVLTTMLLFLSPIFYPVSRLGEPYRTIIYINPLTFIIEQSRAVLIWGEQPDWTELAIIGLISLLFAWGGFAWFQKTRRGFADVL